MRFRLVVLFCFIQFLSLNLNAQTTEKESSRNVREKTAGDLIEPVKADYEPLAFYPKRWRDQGVDFEMLAWEGQDVVFLTKPGEYDKETISQFVQRLDQGWQIYEEIVGTTPGLFKHLDEKSTICAIPKSNLSCGYGCGYVGATGIEASAFYSIDLPAFEKNSNSFQHYYFYEMGRNYFVFGDRHSLFTTGYAVFMRYVVMDRLECVDSDQRTRETIERCEEVYANSDLNFFETFTNLGSGEKSNRLRNKKGRIISPSDQPVMYATAMLKLRNDYGGDEWVQRFYHCLRQCKARRATNIETAKTQCYNWLVCASVAAGQDLTSVFADRWRMPFSKRQRELMFEVDWEGEVSVAEVVASLLNE